MTVDELLAAPLAACELPDGAIPVHAILIVEYANPSSDDRPGANRLALMSDDDLPPWTSMGMLAFATTLEADAVDDEDP